MAERGIDKAALWRALDSTHQTVSKWENGAVPGGDLLAKLPEILDVFPAKTKRTVKRVNLGFINSQTNDARCGLAGWEFAN